MPCNLNELRVSACRARVCRGLGKVRTLHRDERGTISILSVIVLLMLTMLMGMILNVGEQIDDKIKMQNAADAATYSGGVVIARGLNTIAFTNHLLSETFALTAYFREGRDRYAESMVSDVLDAWEIVGPQLAMSDFQLIKDIQPAMAPKIQMERQIVSAFGEMTAIKSRVLLPALQTILGMPETPGATTQNAQDAAMSHLIPTFQRAVVVAIPSAVVEVTTEIAKRNTPGQNSRQVQCVLWSTQTVPVQVINHNDPLQRLLPAVDPAYEGPDISYLSSGEIRAYQQLARNRRNELARTYLSHWIGDDNYDLGPFERETLSTGGRVSAKKSQFINLFRGFTCAKLQELLTLEYPNTNLPHVIRQPLTRSGFRATYEEWTDTTGSGGVSHGSHGHYQLISQQEYLDLDFTFDGAVYRPQRQPTMPGMYRKPVQGDFFTFARVSVYLPRPRFRTSGCPRFYCIAVDGFDGSSGCNTPCDDSHLGWPTEWSLFSQNWAARMIPTSAENTISLLQTNPQQVAPGVTLPNVNSINVQDLKAINFH